MSQRLKQRSGWSLAVLVIVIGSLVPVLWIVMLSLKTPADGDRRELHPAPVDAVQLFGHLQGRRVHQSRCVTRSGSR